MAFQKLLAANWKENPNSEKRALKLFIKEAAKAKRGANVEVAVCPPFIYLEEIAGEFKKLKSKKNLSLGAQDVFWAEKGAYTGEVGPKALKRLGLKYVIVGHSERRKYFKETDAMINQKVKAATSDGLVVILCVGESLAIRRKGIAAARAFVKSQLAKDLKNINFKKLKRASIVIAYEPIWAIGTGRHDDPEDARSMAAFVKDRVRKAHGFAPRVLYGGSVNQANVGDYVQLKSIDGALVGGASLKAGEFRKMIGIVSKIK